MTHDYWEEPSEAPPADPHNNHVRTQKHTHTETISRKFSVARELHNRGEVTREACSSKRFNGLCGREEGCLPHSETWCHREFSDFEEVQTLLLRRRVWPQTKQGSWPSLPACEVPAKHPGYHHHLESRSAIGYNCEYDYHLVCVDFTILPERTGWKYQRFWWVCNFLLYSLKNKLMLFK